MNYYIISIATFTNHLLLSATLQSFNCYINCHFMDYVIIDCLIFYLFLKYSAMLQIILCFLGIFIQMYDRDHYNCWPSFYGLVHIICHLISSAIYVSEQEPHTCTFATDFMWSCVWWFFVYI